jgi:hypothetical protein
MQAHLRQQPTRCQQDSDSATTTKLVKESDSVTTTKLVKMTVEAATPDKKSGIWAGKMRGSDDPGCRSIFLAGDRRGYDYAVVREGCPETYMPTEGHVQHAWAQAATSVTQTDSFLAGNLRHGDVGHVQEGCRGTCMRTDGGDVHAQHLVSSMRTQAPACTDIRAHDVRCDAERRSASLPLRHTYAPARANMRAHGTCNVMQQASSKPLSHTHASARLYADPGTRSCKDPGTRSCNCSGTRSCAESGTRKNQNLSRACGLVLALAIFQLLFPTSGARTLKQDRYLDLPTGARTLKQDRYRDLSFQKHRPAFVNTHIPSPSASHQGHGMHTMHMKSEQMLEPTARKHEYARIQTSSSPPRFDMHTMHMTNKQVLGRLSPVHNQSLHIQSTQMLDRLFLVHNHASPSPRNLSGASYGDHTHIYKVVRPDHASSPPRNLMMTSHLGDHSHKSDQTKKHAVLGNVQASPSAATGNRNKLSIEASAVVKGPLTWLDVNMSSTAATRNRNNVSTLLSGRRNLPTIQYSGFISESIILHKKNGLPNMRIFAAKFRQHFPRNLTATNGLGTRNAVLVYAHVLGLKKGVLRLRGGESESEYVLGLKKGALVSNWAARSLGLKKGVLRVRGGEMEHVQEEGVFMRPDEVCIHMYACMHVCMR